MVTGESLSLIKIYVLFLRKSTKLHETNRMRNIHAYLVSEYGKESVRIFRQWVKIEMKMADFQNHRRFTLRCLSKDVIPVSVKLRSNIKTPKGNYIVRKVKRAL